MARTDRTPLWVKAAVITLIAPLVLYPALIGGNLGGNVDKTLIWLYPIFVLAGGAIAWYIYTDRPELSITIMILMLLCHGGIWWLNLKMNNP